MPNKSIGQFIAALRKANGLTQKELAEKLNVSDKAISRWERDECAPDISLIPVIAEIFSVTCDELLCGERKPIDSINSEDNENYLSPKAEKQQLRILKSTLAELKNKTYIVIAISVLGLIAAAVCNLGFNRAYIGFFAAISFYAIAVVCQLIFTNKAFFSVSDVEIGVEEIDRFKISAVNITSAMLSFIAVLTAFCLPLLILPDDAYFGIEGISWLTYGALYAVPASVACLLLCSFVSLKTAKKAEQFALYRKNKRNLILKVGSIAVLAVVMFVTFGTYVVITDDGNVASLTDGTTLDPDGFVALMETDVPMGNDLGNDYIVASDNFEDNDEEDNEYYEYVYDDDNHVICKFIWRNYSVCSYEYSFNSDNELVFRVITESDMLLGEEKLNRIHAVFAAAYIAEIAGVAIFYFKKRKKINELE